MAMQTNENHLEKQKKHKRKEQTMLKTRKNSVQNKWTAGIGQRKSYAKMSFESVRKSHRIFGE